MENRSLIFPISQEQLAQLKKEAFNTTSIITFFRKNSSFPGAGIINGFIKLLDIYNDKMFNDWKRYISLRFEKMETKDTQALMFVIAVDADSLNIENNVLYRRWWKALKGEKPTVMYYVKTQAQEQEEKKSELFKVINKQTLQRDKKQELAKSVSDVIDKKGKVKKSPEIKNVGAAVEEPKKGIDYLIKKKESRSK